MNKILLVVIAVLLLGCAGISKQPFIIQTNQDDKFADKSTINLYGLNNRISDKSLSGGIHIDAKGIYINPFAFIAKNGDIGIGLSIKHYTSISTSPLYGGYETMFNPIKEIIFLVNGIDRIAIKMSPKDYNVGTPIYNSISRDISSDTTELSQGELSLQDYKKIAMANTLDIKIIGGKASQTFNNNELDKDFILNLKQFYNRLIESK